ncbi:hypothetical protein NEF87_003632 [Candidatus Lokiarchaeum ossiferum]|uniref:Transcription elongation factor Spt5 n=1 Tax=Candidatus Lokiarchaeum ossiferum TaxID=2951803 RepID=A0ABY6HYE9_9ARCH|nr:hypothetical protein NEF87_003632 [Candidatus Lokiarchaeum sp. B-35]
MSPDDINITEQKESTIFAVRTTIGQEKSVLTNIFNRLKVLNPFPDLKALMIAEELRGYVFVEATHQRDVMITIAGLRHIKGKIVGSISLDSISHVISPRKVTEILEEGDTVEIVSGIFMGQKAQVIRMPKEGAKEEVTLRLLDSDSAISIKIHGDFLKLIEKGARHQEEYIIKDMEVSDGTTIPASEDDSEGVTVVVDGASEGSDEELFDFGESADEDGTDDEDYDESSVDREKSDDEDIDEDEDDEWSKFGF